MKTRNQQHTDPTICSSADALRRQIAAKRDCLVGRQRRKYSAARQRTIDQLGDQYRQVFQLAFDTGIGPELKIEHKAVKNDDDPAEAVCRIVASEDFGGMQWVDLLATLTKLKEQAQRACELIDWDNRLLGEVSRMEEEWGLCPKGYNDHYHDGVAAHNQGQLPEQAPVRTDDPRITVAWLRGWSRAREAHLKHRGDDESATADVLPGQGAEPEGPGSETESATGDD